MRAQQKLVHGDVVPEKAAPVTARYQPVNGTSLRTTDPMPAMTLSAVNDIGARLRDLIDKVY